MARVLERARSQRRFPRRFGHTPGCYIQSHCISQCLSSAVKVGRSRERPNRIRESHNKRVPGENDSVPHKASQARPTHATSREPFHLSSRPARPDDAPAQRRASIHELPRVPAGRAQEGLGAIPSLTFLLLSLLSVSVPSWLSELINHARHATRAKSVVNIHYAHVRSAAIQHREQGGQSPEARPISRARRHRDHRSRN